MRRAQVRGGHVRGGLVLAGLLSLAACGSNGSTAVIESGSGPKAPSEAPTLYVACGVAGQDPAIAPVPADPTEPATCGDETGPRQVVDGSSSVGSPVMGSPPAATEPSYQLVEPRPGMANKHAVGFEKADVRTPTSLRVKFWGGVEPCYVLDSVKVAYRAKEVVVTLYSGSDPAKPDTACIEIAKAMAVDVKLTEPLGSRTIVDGAQSASAPGSGTVDGGAPAGKLPAPTEDGAKVVTPRPGMADVAPQSWESAKATGARTVRVFFSSGVEPCSVLDSYTVAYEANRVVISLFSGRDPKAGEVSCIMIAESKAVDVTLTEALDGREIVDGSAG